MPQISVEIPESAPDEFVYRHDPEAGTTRSDEETKNRPKMPRKPSIKMPKSSSTTVAESPHGSSNFAWSSPFRSLSKSLIGLFITVLVIARIRSKPQQDDPQQQSKQQQQQQQQENDLIPPSLKRKKTVRILDMSGNLMVPSKDLVMSDTGTPDTCVDNENDFKQELDDDSEWKEVYKPLCFKVFVVSFLAALGIVIWFIISKYG